MCDIVCFYQIKDYIYVCILGVAISLLDLINFCLLPLINLKVKVLMRYMCPPLSSIHAFYCYVFNV